MYDHKSTKLVRHLYSSFSGTTAEQRCPSWSHDFGLACEILWRLKTVQKSPLFLHANYW